MTHQSLYRKYRPQAFDEVVGQDHISRTLRNAVEDGSVAHAYLFTGPRGTGKTTTARILAKALDCAKGPTAEPDQTCEDCLEIAEGRHPDVYELDAASRTGVDAVREEIISRVNYAPTRGRWKVYIIDEVQMLSTSAFNALLKTLEEPPSRTVFILCTTHPHKVPETIQSRCQRFDFHRIGVDGIVSRLAAISEAEGISVEEGVLALVAKHALGGMRDAIGTLEQLAAFGGKTVSLADAEGLLGEVDTAALFEVAGLILDRDVAGCFRYIADLAESGADMSEFVKGLTGHFRDLFVVASVGDARRIVEVLESEFAHLEEQAHAFGSERLARILGILGEVSGELRFSPDPRLVLEVALARMVLPRGELTLAALAERVATLERAPGAAPASPAAKPGSAAAAIPDAVKPARTPREPAVATQVAGGPRAPSGPLDRAAVKRGWKAVLAEVKRLRPARSSLFDGTEVDVDGDTLVVEFASDAGAVMALAGEQETLQLLRTCVEAVLGLDPPIEYQAGRGGIHPSAEEVPAAAPADDAARMLIDELGAEVVAEARHSDEQD
ncbi:MAG: DNA polymerase III subunit gamma/tau [Coriobacteriia bacterium]